MPRSGRTGRLHAERWVGGETVEQPTYARVKYRALDGVTDFVFTFRWIDAADTWRVFIDAQPNYGARSISAHTTHRLVENGRYCICWAGRIPSIGEAKQVAALWADCTLRYITAGIFATPGNRVEISDHSVIAARER